MTGGAPSSGGQFELAEAGARYRFRLHEWLKVTLVRQDDGRPVQGIPLTFEYPDGTKFDLQTDAQGRAAKDQGVRRGTYAVSCVLKEPRLASTWRVVGTGRPLGGDGAEGEPTEPAAGGDGGGSSFVAAVKDVRVTSGDSIDSIAKAHGTTWQALSRFNWGTDVPDEINTKLRDDVGCTHKTRDRKNYVFHESDDPGIVYVPSQWSVAGLATGREHVFRVAPASRPARAFVFSW